MNLLLLKQGYELVIIEDEEVALAGSIPTAFGTAQYFLISVIAMIMISAFILAVIYKVKLENYRQNLVTLSAKTGVKIDSPDKMSMNEIKSSIAVMEADLASKLTL